MFANLETFRTHKPAVCDIWGAGHREIGAIHLGQSRNRIAVQLNLLGEAVIR